MPIITISRQMGSSGDKIAEALANELKWPLIVRKNIMEDYLEDVVSPYEFKILKESAKSFLNDSENGATYLEYLTNKLHEAAQKESLVLMGFGTQMMFRGHPQALHFRIIADKNTRIARIKKFYNVSDVEAGVILEKSDKKRKKFLRILYGVNVASPSIYHAVYNTSLLTEDECVKGIINTLRKRQNVIEQNGTASDMVNVISPEDVPHLKNESEMEFAKILDMYHIDWEYEPKTFPIEWDEEGNVTAAFSPDFYLTKFDAYIELTTMKQKYVTEKNRKAKLVRELYPGTNVKIVYKKDFYSIVERFRG